MGREPRPDAGAMLEALLEHAPFGVALLDAGLQLVRSNAAFARDELPIASGRPRSSRSSATAAR